MKRKILFVVCLLVGLLFLNAGLNKLFNYLPVPDSMPEAQVNMFTAMVQIGWLMPLIAVVEIVGAILFIIPRFRALGAVVLCPVLIGIMIVHLTVVPEGLPVASGVFAIWLWSVIENREKLIPLLQPSKA